MTENKVAGGARRRLLVLIPPKAASSWWLAHDVLKVTAMLIKMVVSVSQVMDLQGTDMYYLRELSKMLSHNF